MSINADILTICECLNNGHLGQATKLLNDIGFSFQYGMGKKELTWQSFENLLHIVTTAIGHSIQTNQTWKLCPITKTESDPTEKRS